METDNATALILGTTISIAGEIIVNTSTAEATHPPLTTTFYLVYLDPLRISTSTTSDEIDHDAVAVFRYETDGIVHLEALSSLLSIYPLAGPWQSFRMPLRVSKPGMERYYVMLMQDVGLEVKGIESNLVFRYELPCVETYVPSTSPPFQPPQVQVQHSMNMHESAGNGMFTPTMPLSALDDERKVYETPAVKARHIDPNSSPRRRPTSPISATRGGSDIVHTRSGLMRGGDPAATQGTEIPSDSEDEVMNTTMEPITMNELDGILATPPVLESLALKETNVGSVTPSTSPPDRSEKATGQNDIPDSLPDVFKYREQQKLNTPAKTYGRRKRSTTISPASKPSNSASQETNDSTAPQTAASKRSNARKRKSLEKENESEDDEIQLSEVIKKRKGEDGVMPPPSTKKLVRGRGKKQTIQKEVLSEAESEPTAPEKSLSEEPTPKAGRKAVASKKKEPAKPAKAIKGKKPLTQESSLNNTQYTFPYNSDEDESTPQPPPKTPRARGKAAAKKTPAKPAIPASTKKRSKATELVAEEDNTDQEVSPEIANLRTTDRYEGPSPKISFSNSSISDDKAAQRFIRSNGGKQLSSPALKECNFLVVGAGELKRTPKFIVAVAIGIRVVEEQWIIDSKTAGYWVDPDVYTPNDPEREKEWQFNLVEAIQRGKDGKNKVLEGKIVYLTTALVAHLKLTKNEESLSEMITAAGAQSIVKKSPRGEPEDDTLILGKDDGDKDLTHLKESGWDVFGTTVVGFSVLRGLLQDGEEFMVKAGSSSEDKEAPKKRGGRK